MERNDVHSPSNIIPADYEYVAQNVVKIETFGDVPFVLAERKRIAEHMARTSGTYSAHSHGGNCGICGSVNAVYTVLFYHAKTNTYISVGQDCASTLDAGRVPAFKSFRKLLGDYREAIAGKNKAKALLSDAGLLAAWDIYNTPYENLPKDITRKAIQYDDKTGETYTGSPAYYEEITIKDIVGKFVKYGNMSDKAKEYVRVLLGKIENRASVLAARAEENANTPDAPSGHVQVTGVVLSLKQQESDYGIVTKMLVKASEGFKVWCTVPSRAGQSVDNEGRVTYGEVGIGDTITIKVTLTVSDHDKKFAYGKRPTLVSFEPKEK